MALLDVTTGLPQMASRPTLFGLPLKQVSLISLTFQNSAATLMAHYTRTMPTFDDHRYFTSTAIFLTELIKLTISLTFAISEVSTTLAPTTPATVMFQQIYMSVFRGDGWKLAIPATLYTLQNTLQYVAVENLEPVHYQVVLQLKILMTAIFTVLILGKPLSYHKWIALIILTIGVSFVSIPSASWDDSAFTTLDTTDQSYPRSAHEIGQVGGDLGAVARELTRRGTESVANASQLLAKRSASYEGIQEDQDTLPIGNYSIGISAALVVATLSSLTGVFFEKVLKDPQSSASVWIRNIQLSFYSIISAFLFGVLFKDGDEILTHGFFIGYSWVVWSMILLQAGGGILASLCIKYADNIAKNFATSISIVISFVFTLCFFVASEITPTFILGTALVFLATYLYAASPGRQRQRLPPISIVNYEKTTVDVVSTPQSSSRLGVPGQLDNVKSLGLSTSRPSSPLRYSFRGSPGKDRARDE
ncbi:UDP-galactose transporter [Xylaria sp. CBS 124048]|nr:UDP-galactose transporter [Xylaria sp. CBS 124048]